MKKIIFFAILSITYGSEAIRISSGSFGNPATPPRNQNPVPQNSGSFSANQENRGGHSNLPVPIGGSPLISINFWSAGSENSFPNGQSPVLVSSWNVDQNSPIAVPSMGVPNLVPVHNPLPVPNQNSPVLVNLWNMSDQNVSTQPSFVWRSMPLKMEVESINLFSEDPTWDSFREYVRGIILSSRNSPDNGRILRLLGDNKFLYHLDKRFENGSTDNSLYSEFPGCGNYPLVLAESLCETFGKFQYPDTKLAKKIAFESDFFREGFMPSVLQDLTARIQDKEKTETSQFRLKILTLLEKHRPFGESDFNVYINCLRNSGFPLEAFLGGRQGAGREALRTMASQNPSEFFALESLYHLHSREAFPPNNLSLEQRYLGALFGGIKAQTAVSIEQLRSEANFYQSMNGLEYYKGLGKPGKNLKETDKDFQ